MSASGSANLDFLFRQCEADNSPEVLAAECVQERGKNSSALMVQAQCKGSKSHGIPSIGTLALSIRLVSAVMLAGVAPV